MKTKILIVDDEKSQRELLGGFLKKKGYETVVAGSAEEGLELFEKDCFNLAILDIKLPGMDGIQLVGCLKELDPDFPAILLTAFGTVESAVRGMKAGAYDYLTKPINLEELLEVITKALKHNELITENKLLKEQLREKYPGEILSESNAMQQVLDTMAKVAPTDVPVLIRGESGTGKELAARTIYALSTRKNEPFIAINCAAIPENLLESEMFGYEKGAFTGATGLKKGKIEIASSGTIFFDEIGDMPPGLQSKLLRFLQDGKFYRLGSTVELQSSARIIAATNQNLEKLISEKAFREDLYFRLKVITIEIPPLRLRKKDIMPLANFFLDKFSRKHHKDIDGFSPELRKFILNYSWPGNVRELENSIERAVVLTQTNLITMDNIGYTEGAGFEKPVTLEEVEKKHIEYVLNQTGWMLNEAADMLGIHRNTMRMKIEKYGLKRK
ncbi:sigma-54-dependent Fis family transcriptional regulator [bacterium]|nr:sigma-54-dependent Fis family transcriptional regulator [bacterium]